MPRTSLVSRLETDAKVIRVLLLVRTSLWTVHGAKAMLPFDQELMRLDYRLEIDAIDAALRALGVDPPQGPKLE